MYGDMTPNRVYADPAGDPTKGRLYEPRYVLQTEFEYGVTDHTELGFYQVFQAEPKDGGDNALKFDGFKWRVRHRFAEAGQWPVDVAVYVELETMHDEISLEEKLLLSKRFGDLRVMTNLWIEQTVGRPYDAGTKKVALPARGKLSAKRVAMQKKRWFRRAMRWRAGIESRISTLKHVFDMARARYKGADGFERHVGWSVIANNLVSLARGLVKRKRQEEQRDKNNG